MADALTIALLPVPLALVHIPRTRLSTLSHAVLRHILHPSPTFFTVTANEIEISLFVDYEHVHDFDLIARKDRRSIRDDPVEISYEPWSVLQIDSHTDQHDNSGARVNELSGPLAAAGISILYQSSYMCDFIFVKQSHLQEALTLFETAGFDLYPYNVTSSPIPPSLSNADSGDYSSTTISSPTVLTLTQSSILSSRSSGTPTSCSITPIGRSTDIHRQNERTNPHSPTSGEVSILHPDLACVGLSDELGADHWGLKVVKLVAFPELIPTLLSSPTKKKQVKKSASMAFSSFLYPSSFDEDEEDDGYFSHSSHSLSTTSLASNAAGPGASSRRSSSSGSTSSSTHSIPRTQRTRLGSAPSLPPINTTDLLFSSPLIGTSSPLIGTTSPMTSTSSSSFSAAASPHIPSRHHISSSSSPPSSQAQLQVPFFSFTRTQEGSSLTADVKTLAALFPPEERHLLVCCNNLDFESSSDEDEGLDGEYGMGSLHSGGEEKVHGDEDNEDDMSIGELKCLQVDLRRFGLDKYGLVNKFSRVLGDNGVNHMYSSTFKTANILVNKRHARRAQALLRGC